MFQKSHYGFTLSKQEENWIESITLSYGLIKKQRNDKCKTSIGLSLLFIFSLDKWTLFYTIKGLMYSLGECKKFSKAQITLVFVKMLHYTKKL